MALLLLGAFLVIPLIEVALFVMVGQHIGVLATVGLCIVTAVLGAGLVRWQGLGLLMRAQDQLRDGRVPAGAPAEGALIVLAGVLLITPGFFTDALGFLLLVPPVRRWVIGELARRFAARFALSHPGPAPPPGGDQGIIIEGEATDLGDGPPNPGSPWHRNR